jgi:glutathione synthase/RimK-type ligase-like ATP-grasp enzyme
VLLLKIKQEANKMIGKDEIKFNKQFVENMKLAEKPEESKTLYDKQWCARNIRPKDSDNLFEQIVFAQKKCGKHPFSIITDISRLLRGNGRLTRQEYFMYQLYDDEKYSKEDKGKFISEKIHWPVTHTCCDMSWSALAEDKWLCYKFLESFDIRVPETIAVIDKTFRSFGSIPKISSPMELKDFFGKNPGYPIFAKPNAGIGSFGAFIITGIDDTHVFLDQSEPLTFDNLFEELIGERTFLLQSFIKNHPVISAFSQYLATIRAVNFVKSDSVVTPFYVLKIPSSSNIADNYWRKGNIIADLDPGSGVIRRAIRGRGIDTEELDNHPETGDKLVGLQLPYWNELKNVNHICARLFAPVRYNTLDIALTQDGPMVIEVNTGGSFELPQLASGSGFLTEEICDFLESCGWKFRKRRQ